MALGILEQLGLAASLVFAIPVALYGLQQAAGGDPLVGGAFLVVAALMVYLPKRITTPGDIPGIAAEKAVSTAVGSDREREDVGPVGAGDDEGSRTAGAGDDGSGGAGADDDRDSRTEGTDDDSTAVDDGERPTGPGT